MIIDELFEAPQQCPECGGISFSDLILAEKKDACYHKVKASAKVWPSAYASGRLVQCRKKGAANYGNKSEGVAESMDPDQQGRLNELIDDYNLSMKERSYWEADSILDKITREFGKDIADQVDQQGVAEGSEPDAYGRTGEKHECGSCDGTGIDTHDDECSECGGKGWVRDKESLKKQGVAETRRGQIPMTLQPGETDNIEPENISGFRTLPAYKQGQAAQQKAGKQLIQKSPHTYQSDQDWAYRQGAFDAQQAAMFANFGKSKPLTIEGGEQQKGADYRDPKEVDYDDEYDAMVARVKKLAGVGPMRTVYDPNKRVYRNMPTAQQPKK